MIAALRSKPIRIVAYSAFGVLSFFLGLYITFPSDAVAQRVNFEIHSRSQGSVSAEVTNPSLWRGMGVSARDVRLKIKRDEEDPVPVKLDRVRVSVDLLPLVTLNVRPRIAIEVGDADLGVAFSKSAEQTDVEIDIDHFDLQRPPILSGLAGLSLGGILEAEGALLLGSQTTESSGSVQIELANASLGPGSLGGLTLPAAIDLGTLKLSLSGEDGNVKISNFQQDGGQVSLEILGDLSLASSLGRSRFNGCLKFKFIDTEFLNQFPKLATAMEIAGAGLAKDDEQFLNIPLRGTLLRSGGGSGISAGRGVCRDGSRRGSVLRR